MNDSGDLLLRAMQFAKDAHDSINHRRKYSNEPYWVHPERVAGLVSQYTADQKIIAAAWMHDVLEDVTPINADYDESAIEREFGADVLTLALEVTDVSKPEDGNRYKKSYGPSTFS